jgi:hypothetical protein
VCLSSIIIPAGATCGFAQYDTYQEYSITHLSSVSNRDLIIELHLSILGECSELLAASDTTDETALLLNDGVILKRGFTAGSRRPSC